VQCRRRRLLEAAVRLRSRRRVEGLRVWHRSLHRSTSGEEHGHVHLVALGAAAAIVLAWRLVSVFSVSWAWAPTKLEGRGGIGNPLPRERVLACEALVALVAVVALLLPVNAVDVPLEVRLPLKRLVATLPFAQVVLAVVGIVPLHVRLHVVGPDEASPAVLAEEPGALPRRVGPSSSGPRSQSRFAVALRAPRPAAVRILPMELAVEARPRGAVVVGHGRFVRAVVG